MKTFWLSKSYSKPGTSVSLGSSVGEIEGFEFVKEETGCTGEQKFDCSKQDWNSSDYVESPSKLCADKMSRLIDWHVDVLSKLLRQVVARRQATLNDATIDSKECLKSSAASPTLPVGGGMVIEDIKDIIELPCFDSRVASVQQDPDKVVLSQNVVHELRQYVSTIAAMYQNHPFHNFEHASHVTMSVRIFSATCKPDH